MAVTRVSNLFSNTLPHTKGEGARPAYKAAGIVAGFAVLGLTFALAVFDRLFPI